MQCAWHRLRTLPGSKALALLVSLEVLRLGWVVRNSGVFTDILPASDVLHELCFLLCGDSFEPKNLSNKTLMSTKSRSKDFSVSLFRLGESLATLAAWAWETQSVNQVHVTMPFWKDLFEIVWLDVCDVSGVQDTVVETIGKLVVLRLEDVSKRFFLAWCHHQPCRVKVKDDDTRLLEVPVRLN